MVFGVTTDYLAGMTDDASRGKLVILNHRERAVSSPE